MGGKISLLASCNSAANWVHLGVAATLGLEGTPSGGCERVACKLRQCWPAVHRVLQERPWAGGHALRWVSS